MFVDRSLHAVWFPCSNCDTRPAALQCDPNTHESLTLHNSHRDCFCSSTHCTHHTSAFHFYQPQTQKYVCRARIRCGHWRCGCTTMKPFPVRHKKQMQKFFNWTEPGASCASPSECCFILFCFYCHHLHKCKWIMFGVLLPLLVGVMGP